MGSRFGFRASRASFGALFSFISVPMPGGAVGDKAGYRPVAAGARQASAPLACISNGQRGGWQGAINAPREHRLSSTEAVDNSVGKARSTPPKSGEFLTRE